jgi:hypothetical protein
MGLLVVPHTYVDNENPLYTDLNNNFQTIYNEFNGNIQNANISSSAGIVFSKLDSTTVAGVSAVQTLTNKTLTKPTISGSLQSMTTDTDGATVTMDLSTSNIHTVTLGGNRTLALSNVSVGQAFMVRLVQDGTGSRTVTWFATIKWPNGVVPTLTTTASKTDVFGFICTSSGNYDGYVVGQNL